MNNENGDEVPRPAPPSPTADPEYARRLYEHETSRRKRLLDGQRLNRWNLRRWHLGRVLDVGCGIGRNLADLGPGSVGVDHNQHSIDIARRRGLTAYTVEEFFRALGNDAVGNDAVGNDAARFDAMLVAHVIEHMTPAQAHSLLAQYLPLIRPAGRVMMICPQEKGYASDPTHVTFADAALLESLARDLGLTVERSYSFPLPRVAGRYFTDNEFCLLSRVPVPSERSSSERSGT